MNTLTKFSGASLALALFIGLTAPSAQAFDVVETAKATPELSTLVELVVSAGLVDALKEADGITVFAPTNDAFAKLPKVLLRAIENDPSILASILTYHVAPKEYRAIDVASMKKIGTLQGSDIRVRVAGSNVFLNASKVTATDIETDNAVVHLINRVLVPLHDRVFWKDVIAALKHKAN